MTEEIKAAKAAKVTETTETTEDEKPIITPIYVDVYPDIEGKSIESRKYSPKMNARGDKVRFDCRVIVPENEQGCMDVYNLSVEKIIEMGIRQHTYNEIAVTGLIKSAIKDGIDIETEEFALSVGANMREALMYTEREKKVSEAVALANKTKQLYRDYGLDPVTATQEDLIAAIQKGRT